MSRQNVLLSIALCFGSACAGTAEAPGVSDVASNSRGTSPATSPDDSAAGAPDTGRPVGTLDDGITMSTPPTGSDTPQNVEGDIDAGLRPFIDIAVADLATRLDVDAVTITTYAAVLVVWPDSSLGCPRPGMSYAQAATDGSMIELEHDARFYRYHTGGKQGPVLCDT